jgi:uncharacterized protein (TIGR02145 family)
MTTAPTDTLSIPLVPSASGVYSTRKLSINVATNNPTGYTMTMSAGDSGNALTNPTASTNNTLPAASGSVSSPSAIGLNTWGYAAPKTQTNSTGLLPNDTSGFGNTYAEYTSVATLSDLYAGMPLVASPLTLKATAVSGNNDSTDLYFGVRADTTKPAGNYWGSIVLTAVANYVPPETPTTMQGMNAAYCDSMSPNATLNLRDTRDNNTYTIAKIGNRCWMAQNLALGNTSGTITLTPNDSDIATNWTLPVPISNGTDSNGVTAQWIPANANGNYYCAPTGSAKCGNLYNWFAATAGTGTPSFTTGNAPSSICPAGWYLSTGGASSDFTQLDVDLGGTGTDGSRSTSYLTGAPWSAVYSGYYADGLSGQSAHGDIWSSTAYTSSRAMVLYFTSSLVTIADSNELKVFGLAVRCVLRD